jgi:hypothetical protein
VKLDNGAVGYFNRWCFCADGDRAYKKKDVDGTELRDRVSAVLTQWRMGYVEDAAINPFIVEIMSVLVNNIPFQVWIHGSSKSQLRCAYPSNVRYIINILRPNWRI